MGRIVFVPNESLSWVSGQDVADERGVALDEASLSARNRQYFPRQGEDIELFEVTFPPNTVITPHAHTESEIIVITVGSVKVGRRFLGAGSAIYVDKHTLYGFTVGAEGVTYLNFRQHPAGFISRAQFMELRKLEQSSDGADE